MQKNGSGCKESQSRNFRPPFQEYPESMHRCCTVKSHPRGFERGLSVIQVQIILTASVEKKKAGIKLLRAASRELGLRDSKTRGKGIARKISKMIPHWAEAAACVFACRTFHTESWRSPSDFARFQN